MNMIIDKNLAFLFVQLAIRQTAKFSDHTVVLQYNSVCIRVCTGGETWDITRGSHLLGRHIGTSGSMLSYYYLSRCFAVLYVSNTE